MFSDLFSEGQDRDINEEFPSDSDPYTDCYDYPSDSDLEYESSRSGKEEDEVPECERNPQRGLQGTSEQIVVFHPPSPVETSEAQHDRSTPFTIECSPF